MTIPKDLRKHFPHPDDGRRSDLRGRYMVKLKRSLGTSSLATAEIEKLKYIYEWKRLFKFYREGGTTEDDVNVLTQQWREHFERSGQTESAMTDLALRVKPEGVALSPSQEEGRLTAYARSTGRLCALEEHIDAWVASYGYSPAVGDDAAGFIRNRFMKLFPYFEWIEDQQLKDFVITRMDGSDGQAPWARTTAAKYLSYVKQYWGWCRDRGFTEASNLIVHDNILPKVNKTKSHRRSGKDANLPYSVEDCWKLYDAAVDQEKHQLADMIILGMYTGCRIGELAHMKLDAVGVDRFTVEDSKTDSGLRDIPIHKDIQQIVERLKQTSEDGYLISGLSDNNKNKNRGKGIGQKFMRHKLELGFAKKESTFHSFRSTLATRFQNVGVEELFAARIIGHAAGNSLSYGLYAGDIDWDKAVAAMAKVSYQRPPQ